jgi:glycosyltransferase involved in cell wall biosynthesis
MSGGARAVGPAAGGCWQSLAEMVTVVVISRNRREALLETLSWHEAPVILVDNASRDGTVRAVLESFPSVRVIPLRRNAGAAARNLGVRLAATPYVAFADDDSWWAPGALDRAVRHLSTDGGIALLAAGYWSARTTAWIRSRRRWRPPRWVAGRAALAPTSSASWPAPQSSTGTPSSPPAASTQSCTSPARRSGWRSTLLPPGPVAVGLRRGRRRAPPSGSRPVRAGGAGPSSSPGNSLLTAVMRRPWPVVCRMAFGQIRAGGPEQVGAIKALPGYRLRWSADAGCPGGSRPS